MHEIVIFAFPVCFVSGIAYWLWRLKNPVARPLGSIVNEVRVIEFVDTMGVCSDQVREGVEKLPIAMRREARRNQRRIVRVCAWDVARNTKLFHQFLRFERMKIGGEKSSLDYTSFENEVYKLTEDAGALRLRILRFKFAILCASAFCGWQTFELAGTNILVEYKKLEECVLILCRMGKSDRYYDLLRDRLGLVWGIYQSPDPDPELAS